MHQSIPHPLIKHKITLLRDKNTGPKEFRELMNEITMLICYEALKTVELEEYEVETPLARTTGWRLKNEIIIVPILRAGVGMLDGLLSLIPTAAVGFVGIYREHDTALPVTYYEKIASGKKDPIVFIIDPMLATGGSLNAAIDLLRSRGFMSIYIISVIAAPEGIRAIEEQHPDVQIFTGSIDEYLDENKYIIPGLGDAGDRLYGTK